MSLFIDDATIQNMMRADIERFLSESRYTDATAAGYRYELERLATWMSENHELPESLTVTLLNKYLRAHGWANNTQRHAGFAAKAFLKWMYGAGHPALLARLPRDNSSPGRYLTETQLDALLALFDTTKPIGWRNLSTISLMVEAGLRASEVCRLDLKHINLDEHKFDVLAKGQKWRPGVYSDATAYMLDVWLTAREKIAARGCSMVFVGIGGNTPGKPMTSAGLRANFACYGAKLGTIIRLSPHDLRRTMAMLLTKNGAPSRLVQKLGGWEDIRQVERYTRNLEPEQIDRYSPVNRSSSIQLFK